MSKLHVHFVYLGTQFSNLGTQFPSLGIPFLFDCIVDPPVPHTLHLQFFTNGEASCEMLNVTLEEKAQ